MNNAKAKSPAQYIGLALLAGFVLFELVLVIQREPAAASPDSFEAYATEIVDRCAGESYRPSCYDKYIPELMGTISMEDAFKVTSIVQDKDPDYRYCHVLGHELSAREVQKDPSQWKEVLTRCPSGVCSNGCLHGGLQERFRAETLTDAQVTEIKPDLLTLCEKRGSWNPTGLEQASCYHAMGHLTMYLTGAEIRKAVVLCEELTVKPDGRDYRRLCYDGAFMQIFQPLEPEDFALIKGKEVAREELLPFCSAFDTPRRSSCWTEGWPLFVKEIKTPEGLVAHCEKAESGERNRCYDVLFYVISAQFGLDPVRIAEFCAPLPAREAGRCFANGASRLIETDYRNAARSAALCTAASSNALQKECFNELLQYSTYNFHKGSEAFLNLCNNLPDPWNAKCLSGERTTS